MPIDYYSSKLSQEKKDLKKAKKNLINIYSLFTVKGNLIYIGQTENPIDIRFEKHENSATTGSQRVFNYDDAQMVLVDVIIKEVANQIEKEYIHEACAQYGQLCVNIQHNNATPFDQEENQTTKYYVLRDVIYRLTNRLIDTESYDTFDKEILQVDNIFISRKVLDKLIDDHKNITDKYDNIKEFDGPDIIHFTKKFFYEQRDELVNKVKEIQSLKHETNYNNLYKLYTSSEKKNEELTNELKLIDTYVDDDKVIVSKNQIDTYKEKVNQLVKKLDIMKDNEIVYKNAISELIKENVQYNKIIPNKLVQFL